MSLDPYLVVRMIEVWLITLVVMYIMLEYFERRKNKHGEIKQRVGNR